MAYGIALDIGTTTISGSLLDLETKRILKRFSCLNGQTSYGHDVISRLHHAVKSKDLEKLNKSLVSSIDMVLENLLTDSKVKPIDVKAILAAGNSAMYHFMFSLPVQSLINPPYNPYKKEAMEARAGELGIKNFPKARFKMLPNIGGFIGSDAIAVILATGLHKNEDCILAVDIGTNGEIMLGSKDKIFVASTAAGPAFEGWHISCGMRAVSGAIERAEDKGGKLKLGVIGDIEPKGISGSGLIDLTAILLNRGEIDKTGKLKKGEFTVYDGPVKIVINQDDIREIQLAKAAFSVGIKSLRAREAGDISRFFITGAFGNYINKNNARLIGLIPQDIEPDKIEFINDGALLGAERILANPELDKEIKDILAKTEHVSIAQDGDFQQAFADAMQF